MLKKSINPFFHQINDNASPSSKQWPLTEMSGTFFKWYLTENQNKNKQEK